MMNGASGLSTRWIWRSSRARSSTSCRLCDGDDEVDRSARDEAQVGDLGAMALHGHLGLFGLTAQQRDAVRRRVHRERARAGARQGNGIARSADTELDHPLADDVAAQAQLCVVGDRGSIPYDCCHPASVVRAAAAMAVATRRRDVDPRVVR